MLSSPPEVFWDNGNHLEDDPVLLPLRSFYRKVSPRLQTTGLGSGRLAPPLGQGLGRGERGTPLGHKI